MTSVVTLESIVEAQERIRPYIHQTPVLLSSSINQLVNEKIYEKKGPVDLDEDIDREKENEKQKEDEEKTNRKLVQLYFKCELFQKTGSFKARGACNAVHSLCNGKSTAPHTSSSSALASTANQNPNLNLNPNIEKDKDEEKEGTMIRDFITHSSGNHAQALAWAVTTRNSRNSLLTLTSNFSNKRNSNTTNNKCTKDDHNIDISNSNDNSYCSNNNNAEGQKNIITAHIVMPSNAPAVKAAAVKGYGAEIYQCEPTQEARKRRAQELVEQTKGIFIHPSEDPLVISGQGTVGLELLEQINNDNISILEDSIPQDLIADNINSISAPKSKLKSKLDVVVIPIGGGGLASGIATTLKALSPETLVVCAEPEIANDAFRSKQSGTLCGHDASSNLHQKTIADGLKTTLGPNTFDIVSKKVDYIFTVSEAEIAKATQYIWERMKLAIEPSAGVGIGVILFNKDFHSLLKGLHIDGTEADALQIGVILCGGNIDLMAMAKILELASLI